MILHLGKSVSCCPATNSRSAGCSSIRRPFAVLSFSFRGLRGNESGSVSSHSHGSTRSSAHYIWQELFLLLLLSIQGVISMVSICHLADHGPRLKICIRTIMPSETLILSILTIFICYDHRRITSPTHLGR